MPIAIILTVLVGLIAAWAWLVHAPNLPVDADLHLGLPIEPIDGPALVAIQPWVSERHYQSAKHLHQHLDSYLQAARDGGAMAEGSIVIFPEHIGTWLVAAGAPTPGFGAASTDGAMGWLILSRPVQFLAAFIRSREKDRAAAAIFRMRGSAIAADYVSVFSQLASRYKVTIVAGSIVLPEPVVSGGALMTGEGALYNTSAIFRDDGSIDPNLVRKIHPIPDETGFTASAPASDLPVYETPFGTLGVLICADSWHSDAYASLAAQGVDIVAVPAFLQPADVWEQGWHVYTTGWPDGADRADEMQLTEREAWLKYALGGRMKETNARVGATAFLRGKLWGLGSDGANILVSDNEARVAGDPQGASISAVELDAPGHVQRK